MPTQDKRPDPKPRRHAELWQAYLWWYELMEMRKKHLLRISSAEAGKSEMSPQFEHDMMEHMQLDSLLLYSKKLMIDYGKELGPVWDWLTSIKGLAAGSLAAQLVAQIDDISKSRTVSALWRFSGWAVIDGKAERNQKGVKSPFNRKLKGVCWNIADQFIKQQTPVYIDIYYAEKERLRRIHPDTLCCQCSCKWSDCTERKSHKRQFNDGHIDNRARRKIIKIFLQHLWVVWREAEGLEVSAPYVQDVLGHTHIVEVPA